MVSQGLTSSVLRLQEAWDYVLMVIKQFFHLVVVVRFHICKTTQEICIKYYYLGTSERG